MMRVCSAAKERFEFHLHLLADAASERRAILEDLRDVARAVGTPLENWS
jgi:hypothetical protein